MKNSRFTKIIRCLFNLIIYVSIIILTVSFIGKEYRRWLRRSDVFHIRKINIQGNELMTKEEVIQSAGLIQSGSIWKVDLKEASEKIKYNIFVENVSIERRLPDLLYIQIKEKCPVALINFKGKLYCIDRDGVVLPSLPGKVYDLPVISGEFRGTICLGNQVRGEWIREGLDFLRLVHHDRPEIYCRISEVVVGRPKSLVIYMSEGCIPVLVGKGRYSFKVRYLDTILNDLVLKNKLKKARYIDLRFADQVVIGMGV